MRFSLKWAARDGVKEEQGGRPEELGVAEAEVGALLLLGAMWLGPGEGLL